MVFGLVLLRAYNLHLDEHTHPLDHALLAKSNQSFDCLGNGRNDGFFIWIGHGNTLHQLLAIQTPQIWLPTRALQPWIHLVSLSFDNARLGRLDCLPRLC